jgi:hypothetical protein
MIALSALFFGTVLGVAAGIMWERTMTDLVKATHKSEMDEIF